MSNRHTTTCWRSKRVNFVSIRIVGYTYTGRSIQTVTLASIKELRDPLDNRILSARTRGPRRKLMQMRRSTYRHFSHHQYLREKTNGSLSCNSKRLSAWLFQIRRCKHVQAIRKSKQSRLLQRKLIVNPSWPSQTSCQSEEQTSAWDELIPQKFWDDLFEQALEAITDSSIDTSDLI